MLNRATVKYALELGYMKIQAKDVPKDDLAQLIDWLPSAEGTNDAWINAARCPVKLREVKLDGAAAHVHDVRRHQRSQSRADGRSRRASRATR